ncbi:hypothetical protein K461DRAFT_267825 [Myriangium duriaei CBS 260.36]|uniref:Uncharacterized protein n=1 Tax=Myriangium duriaei CBS 260.36 TaxID=1168546 RepID=A0A9P4J4S0_9PEZI|nr:hypothetical protein K461DRAFT_267825 [Myriangium duriaei CBS 260.36]
MGADQADARVLRLAEGFTALMDEYNILLTRSRTLEQNLLEAKSQFQSFVTQRGNVTPDDVKHFEIQEAPRDIENPLRRPSGHEKWWMRSDLPMNKRHLMRTRYAVDAVQSLGMEKSTTEDATSKISSEALQTAGSSAMPSIVESPLEQDFTIPGTPSRLDCPFASMATRRLSAHAKSVVSRYKPNGMMTPRSSASRINGQVPASKLSTSVVNGDSNEQCGAMLSPKKPPTDLEASIQGSGPVCPIRFLEKSSPEDVAEYFEKHKHEIPRSHEVCVKRYQSNAESIRQLDAKYGNLVSMIQGLGQKHAPMLNEKADQDDELEHDAESADRVRRWADNVSHVAQIQDDMEVEQERKPHFDRPLKDVRVGESPSRPWGIQVPLSVLEKAEAQETKPATDTGKQAKQDEEKDTIGAVTTRPAGKCPFAHGAPPGMVNPHTSNSSPGSKAAAANGQASPPPPPLLKQATSSPIFISKAENGSPPRELPTMTFTGPVFIGYSPDQAAAVIRALQADG